MEKKYEGSVEANKFGVEANLLLRFDVKFIGEEAILLDSQEL